MRTVFGRLRRDGERADVRRGELHAFRLSGHEKERRLLERESAALTVLAARDNRESRGHQQERAPEKSLHNIRVYQISHVEKSLQRYQKAAYIPTTSAIISPPPPFVFHINGFTARLVCRRAVSGVATGSRPARDRRSWDRGRGHTARHSDSGIRHAVPPYTAARRFGLPAAYASEISDTAHHGHRVPEHPAHAGHRSQAHRAPGRIHFGNQVSRVPDIRRCRASCVGHKKVGHEKGESGIGFPFGRPLLRPHPGRRGYFFSGRAIDSRIDVSAMMFFIL